MTFHEIRQNLTAFSRAFSHLNNSKPEEPHMKTGHDLMPKVDRRVNQDIERKARRILEERLREIRNLEQALRKAEEDFEILLALPADEIVEYV